MRSPLWRIARRNLQKHSVADPMWVLPIGNTSAAELRGPRKALAPVRALGDRRGMADAPLSLERRMSPLGALLLTVSAASPASSLFIIIPDVVREARGAAFLSMTLAGLLALAVAAVYAELSAECPHAGGEYAIVGRILGPAAGFAVLGLNFANCVLAAAVFALGLADYVSAATGVAEPSRLLALAAVGAATLLAVLNIRANALATGACLLVELAAAGVLCALGAAHPARPPVALFTPWRVPGASGGAGPAAAILAATVGLFAYDGYGSGVYFGEETRGPRARLGGVVRLAFAIIAAAELLPLAAMLLSVRNLSATAAAANPFLSFAAERGGPLLSRGLAAAVALAIFNALVVLVLMSARQLFALGRDGAAPEPVNAALVRLHSRWRSPVAATLVIGAVTGLLCLASLRDLLAATGSGLLGVYAALCVALLWTRRPGARRSGRGRIAAGLALAALPALAGVALSDLFDPDGRPGLAAAAASALAGLAVYVLFVRGRREYALRAAPDFEAG